jgi:glycyl-tRNA synthetase beta chain
MTDHATLLIELGCEELPARSLTALGEAFRDGIVAGLTKAGLVIDAGRAEALYTPRRLAVRIQQVPMRQPDRVEERRGPAAAAAFDAGGAPTRALVGFAASCGVAVERLERITTDKGEWMVHRATRSGAATPELIAAVVTDALATLPLGKTMRWGDREASFVRPVHWLVMLLGDAVVEGSVLGLGSGRTSRGHRFHAPGPVTIAHADGYIEALRAARVLVDPDERRARVRTLVTVQASALGGTALAPDALIDEVANLVEWPAPIACTFDRDFLRVPQEALVETMQANQKFFAVLDAGGNLTERFIGIANIESRDPAEVGRGYERVIRPRFADAAFFLDEDLKTPLAEHHEALKQVTWQRELGSLWDKSCRVAELARVIANRVGADGALATRAAALAKCDLMTRMVGEFPELQGTMGRHYALAQGIEPEVAVAIEEGYAPRAAGAPIAGSPLGRVLAVAEKLDTLAGLFAIGMRPTGNKDPYSLRRAALGLARTLIEGGLDLDLDGALAEAIDLALKQAGAVAAARPDAGKAKATVAPDPSALAADLRGFILERLRGYYTDRGIGQGPFDAVAAVTPASLVDFDARIRAVVAFAGAPEAASLAAANKRIGNILRQAAEKGLDVAGRIDPALLEAGAESTLADALVSARAEVDPMIHARDHLAALGRLAALRGPVDAFFDATLVMVDDPARRANRLGLLRSLREAFLGVADIGQL